MFFSTTTSRFRSAIPAAMMLVASPAFAHGEPGHATDLAAGFMHPLMGFDHLLAMLAIGLWAAQQSRPALWVLPLLFPAVMVLGAAAGMSATHLPGVEPGVAGSVAILGILIAFAIRMPVWAGGIAVSLFALMHGYLHGVELPSDASPASYGAGFIIATLLLHGAGIAMGIAATGKATARAMRVAGGAIAASGAFLLVSAP